MKTAHWKTKLGAFVVATLLAAPAFAGPPTDYVKERTEAVTTVLAKEESKKRSKELEKILEATIDFEELASRALGEHWAKRSADEQKEFLDLLQELLQANYEAKLQGRKLGEDFTIDYTDEKIRKDRAIVKTMVESKGESRPVDYRLVKKDGKWVIYDVVIDDISLEETYREAYTEIIVEEGWASLIERMKDKVKEVRAS
jgi:phospholipid transport system substrate-binding protein